MDRTKTSEKQDTPFLPANGERTPLAEKRAASLSDKAASQRGGDHADARHSGGRRSAKRKLVDEGDPKPIAPSRDHYLKEICPPEDEQSNKLPPVALEQSGTGRAAVDSQQTDAAIPASLPVAENDRLSYPGAVAVAGPGAPRNERGSSVVTIDDDEESGFRPPLLEAELVGNDDRSNIIRQLQEVVDQIQNAEPALQVQVLATDGGQIEETSIENEGHSQPNSSSKYDNSSNNCNPTKSKRSRRCVVISGLALVIVAIVLGVVLSQSNFGSDHTATAPPETASPTPNPEPSTPTSTPTQYPPVELEWFGQNAYFRASNVRATLVDGTTITFVDDELRPEKIDSGAEGEEISREDDWMEGGVERRVKFYFEPRPPALGFSAEEARLYGWYMQEARMYDVGGSDWVYWGSDYHDDEITMVQAPPEAPVFYCDYFELNYRLEGYSAPGGRFVAEQVMIGAYLESPYDIQSLDVFNPCEEQYPGEECQVIDGNVFCGANALTLGDFPNSTPVAPEDPCPTVHPDIPEEITLTPNTACFVVPDTGIEQYRLTIRTPVYGRYSISEGSMGYSWSAPADGIYYCVLGGTQIVFDEYIEGANVTVEAELLDPSSDCFSDYISFNGHVPIETPENGATSEVYWSSHRYYLHAAHFEYQVQGEEPVTMVNGTRIQVSGDPGDDTYCSIEVEWYMDGLEKRFFAYLYVNGPTWRIEEMRVYDNTEDWAYFENLGSTILGDLGACFTASDLTVSNAEGSEIRFENLTLATFLPWTDEAVLQECIGGDSMPHME